MPQFSDGQKISEALVWDRLIQSGPASYVIWKDGTQTKAECLLKGGTDYTTGTDATVMQAAIDGLTTGTILVKKATYSLSVGLINLAKEIEIVCEPGTVFQPTAAINMITFDRVTHVVAGIKNATLDLNNTASTGLLLLDSWHTINDGLKIINVGTNGVGVKIYSTNNSYLCLSNYVRCRQIKAYSAQIAGSIGVLIDSAGGIAAGTNNVVDVGYLGAPSVETGIKNVVGGSSVFHGIVEGCKIGADISGTATLFLHEEANTTYGIIVRTGAKVKGILRYAENITTEGTGKYILITDNRIFLGSASPEDTPDIFFNVGGSHTMTMVGLGGGAAIDFKDTANKKRVRLDINSSAIKTYKTDETELGGLIAGSAENRPVLKFWDVTANAFKYAYIDNGAWVISATPPT